MTKGGPHTGKERKGKERKGKERKGKERKGKERKGKERKEEVAHAAGGYSTTLTAATAHLAAAVGSPCMHRCPHPISSRGTRTESDRQASAGPAQYTQITVSHWYTGTVGLDARRQDADQRSAEISV